MWPHGACFFSMMRTKVPDAFVAMRCPPIWSMDFIMSCCAPTILSLVHHRWPSGLNLVGQDKVVGRIRVKKVHFKSLSSIHIR